VRMIPQDGMLNLITGELDDESAVH
jgi:hypothetical protein